MGLEAGRYRFNGESLLPIEIETKLRLYVADSWLTVDGATIALERHFTRFAHSADAQGMVRSADPFLAAVRQALPRTGAWFPRIELTERGELQLWLRPAPERTESVVLWTAPTDPRIEPSIKGPDIDSLEELRAQARDAGATEPVILTANGDVVDGATTCLLWWRDGSLFMPPLEYDRVESVTVTVLRYLAMEAGVTIREQAATPESLAGAEVWAVNALHGIRPATSWVNGPDLTLNEQRVSLWRGWYESLRQA
jgi:branched-subunit amino acid aminotransferase/4-amino-4-deoxychorismate lyase